MASAGGQIRIGETLANLDRFRGGAICGIPLSREELLLGGWYQQIAALHAIIRVFQNQHVDQALRARQPCRCMARLASKHQEKSQPEGAANGAGTLTRTCSEMSVVSAFERTERVVVPADEIGRAGQQF